MSWIFFALIAAITLSFSPLIGEYFKVRSLYLLFWMRLFCALVMLPVAMIVPAPDNLLFYLYVMASAVCFGYADVIFIGLAGRIGAGPVSRIEPLSVGVTFLLWLVVSPTLAVSYVEQPVRGAAIMLSLAGSLYFASRLRYCTVSRAALVEMMPVVISASIGVIMAKLAMDASAPLAGVVWYAMIQTATVWVLYCARLGYLQLRGGMEEEPFDFSRIFDRRVLLAGAVISLNWLLHVPSKQYAFSLVENPAYVTMIALSAPLWVILFYRLAGRQEKADIWSGLGLLACAALLVAATRL